MTEIAAETIRISASPQAIWAVLEDPAAMIRVFPESESIVAEAGDRYRIVTAVKVMFVTLRIDILATLHDPQPPSRIRLQLDGQPRGYGVRFSASVPLEIEPAVDGESIVSYRVDLEIEGSLPGFAAGAINDAVRHQAAQTMRNLERELTGS